jgi:hypothetical protein
MGRLDILRPFCRLTRKGDTLKGVYLKTIYRKEGILLKILIGPGKTVRPTRRFTVWFLFEPRDMYVGLFWNTTPKFILFYFLLIPMFPLCFAIKRRRVIRAKRKNDR